eukprot:TRINITY_DN7583_c1_g1_i2.p5 TRINITY_DN7583_c1_g1~~TRINITY_DN7583_c1_g1_i2.p5  ORF type:complete len:112 (+),score=0.93 TRINITY_DN7583_c1_g1_i2:660-995(+)
MRTRVQNLEKLGSAHFGQSFSSWSELRRTTEKKYYKLCKYSCSDEQMYMSSLTQSLLFSLQAVCYSFNVLSVCPFSQQVFLSLSSIHVTNLTIVQMLTVQRQQLDFAQESR